MTGLAEFNNYLAVDTASSHLTVLAVKDGKRALRFNPDCALRHSVMLMDEIDSALAEVSQKIEECDFFCAVTGPGSFTGIRIGISAVKGFSLALGRPCMPLTSFELIAYSVDVSGKFIVLTDAAHGHFYACEYDGMRPGRPVYISNEELVQRRLPLYGFQGLDLPEYTRLDADKCLVKAVEKKLESGCAFGQMHALYVRKSQAEEGRK